MKSPEELSRALARQWENADLRESRMLRAPDAWPVSLSIGRPPPRVMAADLDAVRRHVELWRAVQTGQVVWESVPYRSTAEPVQFAPPPSAGRWIVGLPSLARRGGVKNGTRS